MQNMIEQSRQNLVKHSLLAAISPTPYEPKHTKFHTLRMKADEKKIDEIQQTNMRRRAAVRLERGIETRLLLCLIPPPYR